MRSFLLRLSMALMMISAAATLPAQGAVYSILGGLSLSNQVVTGYQKEPFLRFHVQAAIESTSDISPNAMYFRLGYHVKGSAVNVYSFVDDNGHVYPSQSYAMEFHNISASLGWKQRRPIGGLWYSYGFGVRGDYNVKANYGTFFAGLEGSENKFTYGVDVDLGIEFPINELISTTIEFGISPDLGQQIYIPPQQTGWHYSDGTPVVLGETNLTNLVLEARVGFRFWHKVIYTD